MQPLEQICDRPTPLSPMAFDQHLQTNNCLGIDKQHVNNCNCHCFSTRKCICSIAFQCRHEIKIIRGSTWIAWHCQRVPPFAHQLHDLSKCMSSDSPYNLYSRMTRLCDMSDISRMITTLRISRCCCLNFHWNHRIYTVLVQTYPKHCVILRKVK